MTNKTALEQFLDGLVNVKDNHPEHEGVINSISVIAKSYLPTERTQIEEAYNQGFNQGYEQGVVETNDTFNTKKYKDGE